MASTFCVCPAITFAACAVSFFISGLLVDAFSCFVFVQIFVVIGDHRR